MTPGMRRDRPDARPVPPHSIEAELSILGALLLDNDVANQVRAELDPADFYVDSHRIIYDHVVELIDVGKVADVVTLSDSLARAGNLERVGGIAILGQMLENVPTAANAAQYAKIVRERAHRRRMATAAERLAEMALRSTGSADDVDELRARFEALGECVDGGGAPQQWPVPLDLAALAEREPAPPEFLLADWLPCDYATLLAGHGGVGKSGIALHLAACIALGIPFFGIPTARRRVLYLSCEDRESILHWRLTRICAYLGASVADLAGWLTVQDLVGQDTILWERDLRTGATSTAALGILGRRLRETAGDVLIVDGISDTFAGNENARGDVKRYVNSLLAMIPAGGALLLVGHVAKPAAANGAASEGYSGSTGWHNAVRARWYLYPEMATDEDTGRAARTGTLALELQKSNLGPTSGAMTFAWDEAEHLFVGRIEAATGGIVDSIRNRTESTAILRALRSAADAGIAVPAATTGRRTAFHVLSAQAAFPDSLRSGKPAVRRFWRHVEELRAMGFAGETSIRRSDRHYVVTLDLTQEGMRACDE